MESETSPQYIDRQKKYLEYLLEDIFSHPELRNSRILEEFLTLKDHKSMKRKFEEYDSKIKKVTALEELCLLSGEVPIEISEHNRQYNEMLPALLAKFNDFWNSQERTLLQIDELYLRMIEHYKQWSQSIDGIQKEVI